jgi:hypothetical protein
VINDLLTSIFSGHLTSGLNAYRKTVLDNLVEIIISDTNLCSPPDVSTFGFRLLSSHAVLVPVGLTAWGGLVAFCGSVAGLELIRDLLAIRSAIRSSLILSEEIFITNYFAS